MAKKHNELAVHSLSKVLYILQYWTNLSVKINKIQCHSSNNVHSIYEEELEEIFQEIIACFVLKKNVGNRGEILRKDTVQMLL